MKHEYLPKQDPLLWSAILKEEHRQEEELELIASENYASEAVLEALSTVLANKI
jgi:glycine hydroxymethyltransferase